MLPPTYITSSTIDAIGHAMNKLYVRFKSGVSYVYADVPYDIYDGLKKAESAGQFLHRYVKKNSSYRYTKLPDDPFQA